MRERETNLCNWEVASNCKKAFETNSERKRLTELVRMSEKSCN